MTKTKTITIALLAATIAVGSAHGWQQTGGWQCGFARVTTSNDGLGGIDFFVTGAWFDNKYTIRGDMLFYNGELCTPFGMPFSQNFLQRRHPAATEMPAPEAQPTPDCPSGIV
jgi:hypothetical protein